MEMAWRGSNGTNPDNAGEQPGKSPLVCEVELNPGVRAGFAVAHFHFFELALAVDLFEAGGIELLHQLAAGIVGIGMEDAAVVGVDPGDDAGIAGGGGAREAALQDEAGLGLAPGMVAGRQRCPPQDALQDGAGLAVAHFPAQHALRRPMEEFKPEVRDPEIGAGKWNHDFIGA